MVLKLEPSSLPYKGNTNVASLLLDEQKELRTKAISQQVIIETGAILANTDINISLSRYETILKLNSLFVSTNSERNERIRLTVLYPDEAGERIVFYMDLNRSEIPYTFPNCVLLPSNMIRINSAYSIENCFLFLEPTMVLDHYKLYEDRAN